MKIWITGGAGMVGSALVSQLRSQGSSDLVFPSSRQLDLLDALQVAAFVEKEKPDIVFHCAAKVGGLGSNLNNHPSMYEDNVLINTNVITACKKIMVKKIVAMGTGAVYPERAIGVFYKESMILEDEPHASEQGYAKAKREMYQALAASELDFVYVVSCNLYGPNDNYDLQHSHVVPALIRKFHESKENNSSVSVWGDGSAQRDFLYVDDAARALVLMMEKFSGAINMASGYVHSIKEVVQTLSKITGVNNIEWDSSMPNGQAYRGYELTKLKALGFQPGFSLEQGLRASYEWYVKNSATC
jgi:GDP-L-fucose synthase